MAVEEGFSEEAELLEAGGEQGGFGRSAPVAECLVYQVELSSSAVKGVATLGRGGEGRVP